MTDRDPDYGHDCGPDCTCFGVTGEEDVEMAPQLDGAIEPNALAPKGSSSAATPLLCYVCDGGDPDDRYLCPACEDEDDDLDCTHCGGEGTCEAGCDPGWYDDIHACHACNGTGKRRDQVIW